MASGLAPGTFGLVGNYYNINAANVGNSNPDFATRDAYLAFFNNPSNVPNVANVLTSVGNTDVLSFNPSGSDAAMYAVYGFQPTNQIISRMVGKVSITNGGAYTFSTTSDDGSVIFIDGNKVVDNNFYQGMTTRSGSITLSPGFHDIDIGFYEGGGGNGLVVNWAGPGFGNTLLPNSVLFPINGSPTIFENPIDIRENSTINVSAPSAVTGSVTVEPGKTLSTSGSALAATTLTLNGAGAYTISPALGNTFTANDIESGGAPVNITKVGAGVFAIDDLTSTSAQLPAGSTITITQGGLGILLGGATNPLGNATLTYQGGGAVLSSKNGDQTFAIPAFPGSGFIEARQIASGLAGTAATPINITLTGNLNIPAGQTIALGTADNYVLKVAGTAVGTGTLVVGRRDCECDQRHGAPGLECRSQRRRRNRQFDRQFG